MGLPADAPMSQIISSTSVRLLRFFLIAAAVTLLICEQGSAVLPAVTPEGFAVLQAKKDPRGKRAIREMNERLREMGYEGMDVKSPDRWPSQVPVPARTRLKEVTKKGQEEGYAYETNNYRFISQVPLSPEAQEIVGRLFECTYAACKAVARVLPIPRTKVNRSKAKYHAILFKNKEEYMKAGGPEKSAGVFIHRLMNTVPEEVLQKQKKNDTFLQDRVMVPFESLGLGEQGQVIQRDLNSHTLVHEISHQNFVLNRLPIWANEGWGEYFGYIPYMGEVLDFDKCYATILLNAKNPERKLRFNFSLKDFLVMSQEEMYAPMLKEEADTYMLATLTIAYFVHLDGRRGLSAMKNYMNDLIKGVPNEQAIQRLISPHKDAATLQDDFLRAWAEKGVHLILAASE